MTHGLRCARQAVVAMAFALMGSACRDDDVRWTESGGDVAGDSIRLLDYEVTSDRYRQWIAAHQALDSVELGAPMDLDLRNLTEKDIDRVETKLEDHPSARASIEGAGMSVRDFVLTTIALAQPWAAANPTAATLNLTDPGEAVTRRPSETRIPIRYRDSRSDDDEDSWDSDDGRDSDKERRKRRKKGKDR